MSDAIQITAEFPRPAPSLAAVPGLSAERAARLEHLKTAINNAHAAHHRYKKNILAYTGYVIRQGHRLIEAQRIRGPDRFMGWVDKNCPFKHRTADYYMVLAGSGLGIAAIANTGLKATAEEVTRHLGRKSWAKQKTKRTEERRAKLQLSIESGQLLSRSQKKKRRFSASFRDKIAFRSNQRRQLSEQYAERELPDLTKAWKHPHHDGQTLFVRFDMPDDRREEIYVWLPENSHALAASVIAAATVGRWSGATALIYRWLWLKYNDLGKLVSCQVDDGDLVTGDRVTWDKVQEKLSEISSRAKSISEINPTRRDPFVTDILDTWRITATRRPTLSIEDLDTFVEHVTRGGDIRETAKVWFNVED